MEDEKINGYKPLHASLFDMNTDVLDPRLADALKIGSRGRHKQIRL